MGAVLEREPATGWGIDPVPAEHRKLSAFDLAVLWGDLGIGLLVLVTGALLVPGLGVAAALAAIVIGSVIGVGMLAMGAAAGARHGVPTMVLLRPVLGIRGSWIPSVVNAVQLVGWTAVEFWAMSYVADLVSERVFGFSARGLWLAVTAVVCTALALWGPVAVTRVWMERFGAWVIGAVCIAMTVALLAGDGLSAALAAAGTGGFPTFGPALDLVIAMPVSWFPLVADYTRFGVRPRAAATGTFWGYLLANIWLYALGALLVLSAGASPDPAGIALGILAIGGGSFFGVLFLVGLLAGETDEAFANIYSGAVTIQNVAPGVSQRILIVLVAGAGAALAAILTMELYESFLFLIGSLFVPLLGVFAADHVARRGGKLDANALYGSGGPYWFSGGIRVRALIPWIAGFALYHWINPSPLGWWLAVVEGVAGSPLSARFGWLSASIPAFLVSFGIGVLVFRDISSAGVDERGEG